MGYLLSAGRVKVQGWPRYLNRMIDQRQLTRAHYQSAEVIISLGTHAAEITENQAERQTDYPIRSDAACIARLHLHVTIPHSETTELINAARVLHSGPVFGVQS